MKNILIALYLNIFLTTNVAQAFLRHDKDVEGKIYDTGFQIKDLEDLADASHHALSNIVGVASYELSRRGHFETAQMVEAIWRHTEIRFHDAVLLQRDIGWYEPISDALALIYDLTEQKLGYDLCHALRLDDIKTINHGLVVAFRPCFYGFEEYFKHLVEDPKYRGLLPVLSYWTIVIGCSYATYGIGYPFICSPTAYVVERIVRKRVAPKAVNQIYKTACNL